MVSEPELLAAQRRELDRQQRIELALAAGDLEFAAYCRTMNYDEESTPEEDAEDARISTERIASTNWDEQPDANEAMAEEYPEDARLFRQLDEAFPGWDPYLSMLPEEHAEAVEFLRRVDEQLPEAAAMIRGVHEFLRNE